MKITLKQALIHASLFILTFITTTLAGSEWIYGRSYLMPDYSWSDFVSGMSYSIPFLLILTVHEFGHYFTAIYNRINTTLPYYIPLPFFQFTLGTLGALIRIKGKVTSKQEHFDIGIAGPLAGFIATIGVLLFGFLTLPSPEYVFQFHPEYARYGLNYADYVYDSAFLAQGGYLDVTLGKNLLYIFFEQFIGDPSRIPNVHEIMHYPFLFAGFLSLVFTSINLLPIGQLDGGHVLYGLLGFRGHRRVASAIFVLLLFYAGLGILAPGEEFRFFGITFPHIASIFLTIGFYFLCLKGLRLSWQDTLMYAVIVFATQYGLMLALPGIQGYSGWLLFTFIIGRAIGVVHPPSEVEAPLSPGRKLLGWLALVIFIISFTPAPINISQTNFEQEPSLPEAFLHEGI